MNAIALPKFWLPTFDFRNFLRPLKLDGQFAPYQRRQFDGFGHVPGYGLAAAGPPVIETTSSTNSSLSSPAALNLPTGIQSGDRLLMFVGRANTSSQTYTWPAGWTELIDTQTNGGGSTVTAGWRIADGAEGSTMSLTCSVTSSQTTNAFGYRLSNAQSIEAGTVSQASTANPNPPSLSPSWGSANVMWFAACGTNNNSTVSAYPSSYTLGQLTIDTSPSLGIAARTTTASSEDPGTFTANSSNYAAFTIAVQGT